MMIAGAIIGGSQVLTGLLDERSGAKEKAANVAFGLSLIVAHHFFLSYAEKTFSRYDIDLIRLGSTTAMLGTIWAVRKIFNDRNKNHVFVAPLAFLVAFPFVAYEMFNNL